MHKEHSGTVLSTADPQVENENEKGKLLFGKLYHENRSN